ncbi:MAG: glycosyltransferase [Bryobacteraceae bacterium]
MKAPAKTGLRIATLYKRTLSNGGTPCCTMATTRWLRISEALAWLGHQVDMVMDSPLPAPGGNGLVRAVSYSQFDPRRYDVIKTLFHRGFDALVAAGGADHPFIVSKLGSVVGGHDGVEGVHFFGSERQRLFETQRRIHAASRCVVVLTDANRRVWEACHRQGPRVAMVPTGVDEVIPPPRENPYRDFPEKIAVYIGNLYTDTQREVNLRWQARLGSIGSLLRRKGIRLCVVGPGRVDRLDPKCVTYMGPVDNSRVWDYQYFAGAGLVLAQGPVQHNESSKIYYYLRAGLPVVSEAPVPNNHLLQESGLGLVSPYGDDRQVASLIEAAVHRDWDKEAAIGYMLSRHTWMRRAETYARLLEELA